MLDNLITLDNYLISTKWEVWRLSLLCAVYLSEQQLIDIWNIKGKDLYNILFL